MVKAQNTAAIAEATGTAWDEWVMFLDEADAKDKSHQDIAKIVHERLLQVSSLNNPGWWAQGITVAYEQHIGRRLPGQQANGMYDVSASKTVAGERDTVFQALVDAIDEPSHQSYEPRDVRTSITPVRSYWKCKLGTMNVVAAVESKTGKSLITITQSGCPDKEVADNVKEYWKDFLQNRVQ